MDHIHLYEEPEFDAETQERLDCQVDRLLKGYDWTLAPLANKSVPVLLDRQINVTDDQIFYEWIISNVIHNPDIQKVVDRIFAEISFLHSETFIFSIFVFQIKKKKIYKF